MKTTLICLVLFVLAGCATSKKNKEIARLHLAIGTTFLSNHKYHEALAEFMAAEKMDPSNAIVQNNMGLAYYFLGHPQDARKSLEQALRLVPSYTEARNNLARVDIDLALYNEAETLVHDVLKDLTYPTPEKAWINLGLVHFEQRQFIEAQKAFRQAMELDRHNCLAFDYYGRSLFEQRQYAEAARVLDKGVENCREEQFDEPHYYSALSYYRLGKKKKALARLDEIISLYPNGKYVDKAQSMKKLIQ